MFVPQDPEPSSVPSILPSSSSAGAAARQDRLGRGTASGESSKVRRLGAWQVAGDLPASFRYAAQGLGYAFRSQRNFRIHVGTGAVTLALGHSPPPAQGRLGAQWGWGLRAVVGGIGREVCWCGNL